ncbi:MAG: hypothetical protein ACI8XU_002891 [Kiritimatiellia bacterium]|jgi:hypothetical protein
MLTYVLYAALRLPKAPRQEDSILSPTTDFEDWLIVISINGKDGTNWFCPFLFLG